MCYKLLKCEEVKKRAGKEKEKIIAEGDQESCLT